MGLTDPLSVPAPDPEDDVATVVEAIAFMLKIETLSERQRAQLTEIQALVDRRRG